jgi:hypothetical protein
VEALNEYDLIAGDLLIILICKWSGYVQLLAEGVLLLIDAAVYTMEGK